MGRLDSSGENADMVALRLALAARDAELAAMRNSTSWRLTAPLRSLMARWHASKSNKVFGAGEYLQPTIPSVTELNVQTAPLAPNGNDLIAAQAQGPLAQRLSDLAVSGHRVAYLAENTQSSTYRYRAYNMAQLLASGTDSRGALFFLDEVAQAGAIANACSVMVISRARYDHRLQAFVEAVQGQGKQVWFDLDDYLFDTHAIGLLIQTQQQDLNDDAHWHYWYGVVARMADAMALCDGVIVSTPALAELTRQHFKGPVWQIPNFANEEQCALSDALFQTRQSESSGLPVNSAKLQLGYFSGSPSHNADFALLVPALCDWMAQDPRVGLTVAGPLDCAQVQSRFPDRVRRLAFMDYLVLQREVAQVDLNLIPLQSNAFTHCKSELKYFEAALVGTPSLASDAPVFKQAIMHGQNGYLVADNNWAQAFNILKDQTEHFPRVGRAARADAVLHHTGPAHRACVLAWLNEASRI